jgi:hypothetical protein
MVACLAVTMAACGQESKPNSAAQKGDSAKVVQAGADIQKELQRTQEEMKQVIADFKAGKITPEAYSAKIRVMPQRSLRQIKTDFLNHK